MRELEILVCTTAARLRGVGEVLLPPSAGVRYVVCCQGEGAPSVSPFARGDVVYRAVEGVGLSRNRNEALRLATADALLLCDDDERLCRETVLGIVEDFRRHPHWDIIQYQFRGAGKEYPPRYVSSVELAMRLGVAREVRFDERFGLGSPHLACGEEEVFLSDALRRGFRLGRVPKVVCEVGGDGTGARFLRDQRVQRSKGAVFCRTRGRAYAYYKCTREAVGWALRCGVNPVPLLRNMFWGIQYVSS